MRRGAVGAGVLVAGILGISAPGVARAQSANDKAAAETLFEEGRSLLQKGQYDKACPKLAESLRLDTGIGTMLYLAECYERSGKTASAWAQFREAQESARQANDNREKVAKARADKLEPRLSRLAIVVPHEVPGLTITRDGGAVGKPVWGTETPIDPGKHVIRATADGYQPWETTVDIANEKAHAKLEVPALEAAPNVAPPAAAAATPARPVELPPARTGMPTQRVIALGIGVLGVVGVGVGTFFGLEAMSTLSDANSYCAGNACDQKGLDLRSDSRSQANVATIAFAAGGVALVGAAVLWFTAPTASSSVGIAPSVSPGAAGISAIGRF